MQTTVLKTVSICKQWTAQDCIKSHYQLRRQFWARKTCWCISLRRWLAAKASRTRAYVGQSGHHSTFHASPYTANKRWCTIVTPHLYLAFPAISLSTASLHCSKGILSTMGLMLWRAARWNISRIWARPPTQLPTTLQYQSWRHVSNLQYESWCQVSNLQYGWLRHVCSMQHESLSIQHAACT